MCTEHRCDQPGCGIAMVFDGNMKNHRDVCFASSASSAGTACFKGLEGQVRIGCQDTPAFQSRYCALHKPTAAISEDLIVSQSGDVQSTRNTEEQVGFIVGKRTRTSNLYQVCDLKHAMHNGSDFHLLTQQYDNRLYNVHSYCNRSLFRLVCTLRVS